MNKPNQYFIYTLLFALFFAFGCKKGKNHSKTNDEQELQQLMVKIKALAETSKCGDNAEILSIAVGEKACGGPKIYVPYTSSINVDEFKTLVAKYTALEKTYNNKWNIVSDCALAQPPKSVTCQNGKLIVQYN